MTPLHAFFHRETCTLTYVIWDDSSRDAVVIDPVLDFDPVHRVASAGALQPIFHLIQFERLCVRWILDSHAHADHLTASFELKKIWPHAQWGMGSGLKPVFETFRRVYNWPSIVKISNLGVDRWFEDGEAFTAGPMRWQAISTPGHTPACMTFKLNDMLFVGDTMMMPDSGTGRCDFPGGSALALYDSIWRRIYSLPDSHRIYVGHDYQPGGRPLRFQTTVGQEKRENFHLRGSTSRDEFVKFREARDKTLAPPKLLDASLDWNLGAHQLVKALN